MSPIGWIAVFVIAGAVWFAVLAGLLSASSLDRQLARGLLALLLASVTGLVAGIATEEVTRAVHALRRSARSRRSLLGRNEADAPTKE